MAKMKDIAGERFDRLTAIESVGKDKQGRYLWRCICVCGSEAIVRSNNLNSGNTKSCGCLARRHDRLKETAKNNAKKRDIKRALVRNML